MVSFSQRVNVPVGLSGLSSAVRADVDADDNKAPGRAERMVALLVDGLRFGATPSANASA